uniref:Uncharacterized protein n=1 Tax=viral metagenome TaxID=1070528 RepID=A0A6C0CTL6_9ZZZZ
MYPKDPSIIQITQWNDANHSVDHFFLNSSLSTEIKEQLQLFEQNKSYDDSILQDFFTPQQLNQFKSVQQPHFVYQALFIDDSLLTVLHKICIFLDRKTTKRVPYVWTIQSLRFNVIQPETGYHPNPFMIESNPQQNASIEFLGEQILKYTHLNIIFFEDLNLDPVSMSYYFPSEKDTLSLTPNTIKGYLNEQSLLNKLWYQSESKHKDITQHSQCIYNRASFKATLSTYLSLKQTFHLLKANATIQFIQFLDDINHIYYKVHKQHTIPMDLFDQWINVANINGLSQLVFYAFLKEKSHLYAEIRIDAQYQLYITYKLDFSENITYERLEQHIHKIISYLQHYLHISSISLEIDILSLRTSILIQNTNLKSISKYMSSLLPIYKVPTKNRIQKNILDVQFKRIERYGQTKNIREYIKSKLSLDIPILDILLDLQAYGIDEAEVRDYFEEIQQEIDQPALAERKKRDIQNLGLIMHLSIVPLGIQIQIDNAASFTEITNALFWTRATLMHWEQSEKALKQIKAPIASKAPVEIEDEEEEDKPIIPLPPLEEGSTLSLPSSELSFGGAVGKEYHRYFNTHLKQLDPNIFALTENYARKCQVADLRQPIGITKEHKELIDASPYKDGYDNFIEHGSDPAHKNIYICPRVWCPKSQVPLSAEQYEKRNGTCPLEDEKPMLLYEHTTWYHDINRPHYVGFLKERGYNNVQLPCCFKLPLKEPVLKKEAKTKKFKVKETSAKQFKELEDDTYIIDRIKKIPEARLGTIPQSLHEFIYPNVPYQLCRNTVKSQECLLRRGIATSKDTFMESIAYLMGLEKKEALIQHIQKHLDPLTYLTLENGLVYQTFVSDKPILPEQNPGACKQLAQWLKKHSTYTKLFELDGWDMLLNKKIDILPISIRYQIARQLLIHQSYQNFFEYLKQDDEKNPQLFYDLLHHLGILLVVWNRDHQSLATIQCPYAYKMKQWFMGTSKVLPFLLLLRQDNEYEPLVIVDPSKNITQRIAFTKYKKIETFLQQCSTFNDGSDEILQNLYALYVWIQNILFIQQKAFLPSKVVLDYNHRIIALMTVGNIWIDLPKSLAISNLLYFKQLLPIKQIIYWEDIQQKTYDIRVWTEEYRLFESKIKQLGLGLQIGTIRSQTEHRLETLLVIPKVIYKDLPKVPLVVESDFQLSIEEIEYDRKKWYQTKKYILTKLLKEYDVMVLPWMDKTRAKRLEYLYELFKHLQQPSRVRVILEELPLEDKVLLQKQYDELLLDKPYLKQPSELHQTATEWIFTQKTIEDKDISVVKNANLKYRQNIIPKPTQETLTPISLLESTQLPKMLIDSLCYIESLPTKWRSNIWTEYKILILKEYHRSSLFELFNWLAHEQYLSFSQDDLQIYTNKQIYSLLEESNHFTMIFEDPAMRNAWGTVLKRKYRNLNEFIEGIQTKSTSELQQIWMTVLQNHPDKLWIQDIDLYNISQLLRINLLIVIKGKSAEKKGDDLVSSCKYIQNYDGIDSKYRPLLILYKELSKDKTHYEYGIIQKENKYYYRQMNEAPEEWLQLIAKIRI